MREEEHRRADIETDSADLMASIKAMRSRMPQDASGNAAGERKRPGESPKASERGASGRLMDSGASHRRIRTADAPGGRQDAEDSAASHRRTRTADAPGRRQHEDGSASAHRRTRTVDVPGRRQHEDGSASAHRRTRTADAPGRRQDAEDSAASHRRTRTADAPDKRQHEAAASSKRRREHRASVSGGAAHKGGRGRSSLPALRKKTKAASEHLRAFAKRLPALAGGPDRRNSRSRLPILGGAGVLLLLILILIFALRGCRREEVPKGTAAAGSVEAVSSMITGTESEASSLAEPVSDVPALQDAATGAGELQERIAFSPKAVEETQPTNLMDYTEIMYNGEILEDKGDYEPWYSFDFGVGSDYSAVDGVVTFRGNNFRDNPTAGPVSIENRTFSEQWTKTTGTLTYEGKTWSGNGWTGQPLMARWPKDVRQQMNLYESAKAKEDLIEVIYAGMDGYVYFLDLMTGEKTRDPMYIGWTFKGAGALDPRGYPILYVGAGYNSDKGTARVFIVNLLDCSVMYTFGNQDDFSLRGSLSFFDSSALVDAASDTLIYPGENGILYLMHLNTSYDREEGTLSIDPDKIAKWRYWGERTSEESYWLGMEASAAVYSHYMFICDNGGMMICLDLNTLRLVWVQDILDDSNGSPVLSIEDGRLYVYISTSFHLGWRSDSTATIPIWKLDAETGEVIWHTDYTCWSESGVSGGVQSTIALGKNKLDGAIYVTVSDTMDGGVCVALDKKTGEKLWEHEAAYAWSSPVCVYNTDGTGYVVYCSSAGKMYLLDGLTGDQLDRYDFGSVTIEASPAVYDGYLVVGTRDCEIRCIKIT